MAVDFSLFYYFKSKEISSLYVMNEAFFILWKINWKFHLLFHSKMRKNISLFFNSMANDRILFKYNNNMLDYK